MELQAVPVTQTPEDKFREYLASRPRPQRFTEQQRALVNYVFSQHEHFDADSLCDEMSRAGLRVSRATVYRTLTKLVDAGLLRSLDAGPRKYYEHDYGYPQHEHMQCTLCGAMIEFQDKTLDQLILDVCRRHNFQASGHTFVIRGVCDQCNRTRVPRRRLDLI